jgi:hypothetical protein
MTRKNNKKEIKTVKQAYSREKEIKMAGKIFITKYKVIPRPSRIP